jgi:hypothetical protein
MQVSVILQGLPGAPEMVIILMILLPLIILTAIGVVLIRRLMSLPDPTKVNDLEREVVDLRDRVDSLEAELDRSEADAGTSDRE